MSPRLATLTGSGAILLWSSLAALTAISGTVPAFQLAAMTFLVGGLVGAVSWLWRPQAMAALRQPLPVWALGVIGLFGYHALYFSALRLAPPAESGLINYLWPLLIVVFSTLASGQRLRPAVLGGALLGLAGVAVLITGRAGGFAVEAAYLPGYALAFAAAFVWAGYSTLSRRFGEVPTDAVAGFCLVTALLSGICHLLFEETVWPTGAVQWLALLMLGLGPVGLAFYLWDIGVKKGDLPLLGVLSYAAPVLSTLLLVATGYAQPTLALWLACFLIVAGALMASLRRRVRPVVAAEKSR